MTGHATQKVAEQAVSGRKVLSLRAGACAHVQPRPRIVIEVTEQVAYVTPDPTSDDADAFMAKLASLPDSERELHLYRQGHKYGVYVGDFDDEVADRANANDEDPEHAYARYMDDLEDVEYSRDDGHGTVAPDFFKHSLATDYASAGELADLQANVGHDEDVVYIQGVYGKRLNALKSLALAVHANLDRKTRGRDKSLPKANDEAVAAGIDLAVRDVCHQRALKQPADIAKQVKVRYQVLLAIKSDALKQIQRLGIADALRETT